MEKPLDRVHKNILEQIPGFLRPEEHKDVPAPSPGHNFYPCYAKEGEEKGLLQQGQSKVCPQHREK